MSFIKNLIDIDYLVCIVFTSVLYCYNEFSILTQNNRNWQQKDFHLRDVASRNITAMYRVFQVKLSESKQVLRQVKWIFRIFQGAYYVHHIITFCFLPYFSKKYSEGGSIELLKISNIFFTFFALKCLFRSFRRILNNKISKKIHFFYPKGVWIKILFFKFFSLNYYNLAFKNSQPMFVDRNYNENFVGFQNMCNFKRSDLL